MVSAAAVIKVVCQSSDDCGSFKGCMVEVGGKFSLTARQSMVKVDVAQVFWRPF